MEDAISENFRPSFVFPRDWGPMVYGMVRQTIKIKVTQHERLSVSVPAGSAAPAKDGRVAAALERIVAALAEAWRRASR